MTLQATVALAVVTGTRGVLLIERRDGRPPVAFPGGKVEPGETVEHAAIRETGEETGYRVQSACVLGDRVHPITEARVVYVAAKLATRSHGVGPISEAGGEEVVAYWRPVSEALRLLGPTLFEPARRYLEDLAPGRPATP